MKRRCRNLALLSLVLFLTHIAHGQDIDRPFAPGDTFSISHTPINAKLVPLDCDARKIPIHSYKHAGNEATFLIEVARLAVESGVEDGVENDFHQARLRALARVAELRKMAEPCLDTGQVCKLLGVSRETIRKKVDRKQLLALPKGSEDRVFPAFQFKEGELLPGMKEVLEVLPGDSPFVALSFLLSRSPFFRNKTAVDALKTGMLKEVIAEAGSFLEHGS